MSNLPFQASVNTTDKILEAYKVLRWVILAAPMQSGKSSVYIHLAEEMIRRGMIERVFVISGISDNALRDQTYERIGHIGKVYFLHALSQKAAGNRIAILKEFSSSLIIIDESHIGADVGSSLQDFLSRLGFGGNGEIDYTLYPEVREPEAPTSPRSPRVAGQTIDPNNTRAPYILSVSATPYAEVIVSQRKAIIPHIPGSGYIGLNDLNLINIASALKPEEQLLPALNSLKDTKTYAIVRSLQSVRFRLPNGQMAVIPYDDNAARKMVEALSYPIIYVDMDNETNLPSILEKEPNTFTVILIKKYARAGQTFSKRYVSLVWEILPRADDQAQGLPGRCCGYEDSRHVQVYCNLRLLQEHMEWQRQGYAPIRVPSSGKNVRVTTQAGDIMPMYQKIGTFNTLDEVNEHYREYGYANPPQFGIHQGNRTWTEEEMKDERGRIMQYLPVNSDQDRVKAWPLNYVVEFLTKIQPLIGAINTPSGKRASVAKIAYRDLEDPSTQVYVLYYYDGPLTEQSVGTTEMSMYMHAVPPSARLDSSYTGIVQHISIDPARLSTPEGIESVKMEIIPAVYSPISLVITSISDSEETVNNAIARIAQLTLEGLEWRGYVSASLSPIAPLLIERKRLNIPLYTPANQADTARFIVQIFAPTSGTAITGYELDRQTATRYIWNPRYKRSLSAYLTSTREIPGVERYRYGSVNYYYAPEI